ncbi:hypothetical protein CPB84DRAFT_1957217 [Gymnopilus junonius]|uniref:Uncharacterized protein n=1 Tax=Gymnopilus junonius TaxID=109634 RepID=A0A9P5TU57_GYMJU|nr:hypothetical protein CPB84DRAFT_1957217 [Gymnopilus junonius]
MAPLPSRKSLESMKRADLQKICKDYGVRANLKSEALIDLLLETQSPTAPKPVPRAVSSRLPSKAGPSRVSSMIVHDISGDEDNSNEEQPPPEPVVPVRTRKAKELQKRLGVGKPVIAGGQGPRAVTRSSGSLRSRQTKVSRSRPVLESTIEEEPETASVTAKVNSDHDTPVPEGSGSPVAPPSSMRNDLERSDIRNLVELAIRPLQDQIQTLKSEINRIETIKADIANLQVQLTDVSKVQKEMMSEFAALRGLSDLVRSLKEEIKLLRIGGTPEQSPPHPSTPKAQIGQIPSIVFGVPPPFRDTASLSPTGDAQSKVQQKRPMAGGSTLGKRHRNSMESKVADDCEDSQDEDRPENELSTKVIRPAKKKQKTGRAGNSDEDGNGKTRATSSSHILPNTEDDQQAETSSSNRVVPAFTIFTGEEESADFIDPPPPTDHLPDFFRADSPPNSTLNPQGSRSTGVPTSSANAIENQPHPFGFSFLPISSTPQNPMYMPSFPYPEPPQSPSPAGPSTGIFSGRHDERTDIFKPFGLPSPLRRHYGSLQDDRAAFVNPAALSQQGPFGKRREVSSNDVAAGLGLTTMRSTSSDATTAVSEEPVPSKRTMYGTELESDTRFGDFGVEGVASGFWTNGGKY